MRNEAIAILMGAALAACGGSVATEPTSSTVATPQAAHVTTLASGGDVCPVQLVAIAGSVAWTNRCAETAAAVRASVRAVASDGHPARVLWQPETAGDVDVELRAIASDGARLYFNVANTIYSVDPNGAAAARLGVLPASHDVQWLAIHGTELCASVSIAVSHNSALDTIDTKNPATANTVLTAVSPETYGVVSNANGVSWSNGSLVTLDSAMHASDVAVPMSRALAADPSGGFFVVRADVGSLVSVSSGGSVATVAPAHDDTDIAVDDASVYFTAGATIMRIAKPSGIPTLFATGNAPRGLVVDASHVYWIDGNAVISADK